jgi:CO dehydrogenase nickel-insertion accessory protein CooC1
MPKRLINDKSQTMQSTPLVHLSLQGKGGVGKSLIASLLAQFYKDHGVRAICVDTDPVNQTFSQYAALGTHISSSWTGTRSTGGDSIPS